MKHFLQRLVIFLSLVLLGSVVAVGVVITLNERALGNCRVGDDVDSVVAGDSHTTWSIDDSQIEGLRNVSFEAEGYRYTYLKLRHLLRTDRKIKRVYLGISYHNFAGYYDEYILGPTFKHNVERYLPVLTAADYEALVRNSPTDVLGLAQYIVRRGFKPGIKGQCLLYGGFPERKMTEQFDFHAMERRIQEQFYESGHVAPPSASNIEYLGKIVELCRRHGVEVIGLGTPLHPEYEKRVPEEYRRLLRRLVKEYRLRYYDFGDLKLSDAQFLPDGDHTNYAGAMLTTRRFEQFHEGH